MNKFHNKLFGMFLLVSIVPLLLIGFISYVISEKVIVEKLNNSLQNSLTQLDRNIQIEIQRVYKYNDLFYASSKLQEYLRNDQLDNAEKVLDEYFYGDKEYIGYIIYKDHLISNQNAPDILTMQTRYGGVKLDARTPSWFGVVENPVRTENLPNIFLIAYKIYDTVHIKDDEDLAILYVMFREDLFSKSYQKLNSNIVSTTLITDENGRIISQNTPRIRNIWEYSLDFFELIFDKEVDNFIYKLEDRQTLVTYYTSPVTGWKFIQLTDYALYLKDIQSLKGLVALIVALSFMLMALMTYVTSRNMLRPLKALSAAMQEFSKKNFDVQVQVTTNDEIGLIINGFNEMAQNTKFLFELTEAEQKNKLKAEIKALQYQINPHFLYNTLSSIRFVTLMHNDDKASQMLLVLSRFLRNTISNADKFVTIEDEMCNMKDYIFIHQIRYDNKLVAQFDISTEASMQRIPSMLLQPIIENSIIHGLSYKLNNGPTPEIRITASTNDGNIVIKICDNGVGMTPSQANEVLLRESSQIHIGLKNVSSRIRYIFGDNYGLQINSRPNEYTEVTLLLPCNKGENYV